MRQPAELFMSADRDRLLASALELLEGDDRLVAAVITGSLGAERADRWSDIDITCLVADAGACEAVTADWVARSYRAWPVVHHYETAFGSTLVRGFLLANGLVLDLAFAPEADFAVWAPVRVAFDRTGAATKATSEWQPWRPTPDWQGEAGFAWHDILHACIAVRRGRPWQALYFLGRIRNRTLAIASARHGLDPDDAAHVDGLPAPERDALLGTLVATLDAGALAVAIETATEAFLAELARGDPDLAVRLAEPLRLYLRESGLNPEERAR